MPVPEGYTDIKDAPDKWGHSLSWWYDKVKTQTITGYTLPLMRGTFLQDREIESFLHTPKPRHEVSSHESIG